MKTRRIIPKFSLALVVFISLYLNACDREEWCADCYWECSFDPLTGPTSAGFCADSYEECEDQILEFLDERLIPSCWECTEPYINH